MPYFYQHSEGQIIEKPKIVVESGGGPWDYFSGPFVKDWWFESDLLRPTRHPAPPQKTGRSDEPDFTTGWARAEDAALEFSPEGREPGREAMRPKPVELTPRMMIMVDQVELKSCPFCGSGDVELRESITDVQAGCCNCGCRTGILPLGSDEASAAFRRRETVAAWNTRTAYNPNERLREALEVADHLLNVDRFEIGSTEAAEKAAHVIRAALSHKE